MSEEKKRSGIMTVCDRQSLEHMTYAGWRLVERLSEGVLLNPTTGQEIRPTDYFTHTTYNQGHMMPDASKVLHGVVTERLFFLLERSESDALVIASADRDKAQQDLYKAQQDLTSVSRERDDLQKKITDEKKAKEDAQRASNEERKRADDRDAQVRKLEEALAKVRTHFGQKAYDEAISSVKSSSGQPYR